LDRHGCKRMCLEVIRKRYRGTIFFKDHNLCTLHFTLVKSYDGQPS
jgi:hypothetical protein